MTRILTACVLFLLISSTLGLGFGSFKKIRLEDIEQDNLKSKQSQQEQPKQQQEQSKQQQQTQPAQAQPAQEQKESQPQQQQPSSAQDYTGQPEQQFSFGQDQQLFFQHLQGYQPQYQSPQSFLHAGFLGGNNLGISHDFLSYLAPQHSIPSYSQQFYFPQSGYSGLQFLQAQSPLFYNQHAPAEQSQFFSQQPQLPAAHSQIPQNSAPQSAAASEVPAKEASSAPAAAASEQASKPAEQPQQGQKQSGQSQGPQGPAEPNFEYTPQTYNQIPKELESYTTIPESIYQGKEPDFLYQQNIPDVSLTNEQFNPYNTLYQQSSSQLQQSQSQLQQSSSQLQRPTFSSGVKSEASSLKGFPGSSTLFNRNAFHNLTPRHYPSGGISYTTYRQGGPAPF